MAIDLNKVRQRSGWLSSAGQKSLRLIETNLRDSRREYQSILLDSNQATALTIDGWIRPQIFLHSLLRASLLRNTAVYEASNVRILSLDDLLEFCNVRENMIELRDHETRLVSNSGTFLILGLAEYNIKTKMFVFFDNIDMLIITALLHSSFFEK